MRIVAESALGAAVFATLGRAATANPGRPPVIVASGNWATPTAALRAIDDAVPSYRLFVLNGQSGLPVRDGVIPVTPFVGPGMRTHPNLEYIPARLSLVPRLLAGPHRPDVVVVHTSRPVDGRLSLGTEVNILPAALDAARAAGSLVIAQINRQMPYTFGDGEIPVDAVDLALEVDLPLASPPAAAPDDTRNAIGERVAQLVPDGATVQLGIGAVPDATAAQLITRRDLRIWTETFSDGVLALERKGVLTCDAPMVSSFVLGSPELYGWLDRNPRVRMLRTETVNDPAMIARQPRMTSINTALQIDLHAQANASYVHGRVWSGFGGQPDFVAGALHAPDGHAVIALSGWHAKSNTSTVVPALTDPTTSFQHSHVVSEHGTASLWGASHRQQAERLVREVADPRAREQLAAEIGRAW
jgi:acyl-CoA hydrolase